MQQKERTRPSLDTFAEGGEKVGDTEIVSTQTNRTKAAGEEFEVLGSPAEQRRAQPHYLFKISSLKEFMLFRTQEF